MFIRNCPKCNAELTYKNKNYCKRMEKQRKLCLSCAVTKACKTKDWTPYRTPEFKEKISKLSSGKNNPMYGKTVYDTWIKKYGQIEADRRLNKLKIKHSTNNTGKGNPMYGKPSPGGSGYGWKGWYKGWFFRSLRELSYMINVIEVNNQSWITAESDKYRIQYKDLLGNERTYCADFIVDNKYMIEIKPKKLHKTKLIQIKAKAAKKFCKNNNLKYKLIDTKKLTSQEIKDLHNNGSITFTNRYEQKYQETYNS